MYLCMHMLYFVWPFDSLYYCDKLRSGIYLWKTTVVCQPQLSVNLKVNWGIAGETRETGAIIKKETNLVQNYAFWGGKSRALTLNEKLAKLIS